MTKHVFFVFYRGNSAYEYALVSLFFNATLMFILPNIGKLTFLHVLYAAMGFFWSNGLWLFFRLFAPKRPTITFLLSHTLVIFFFVVNAYHYTIFSEHLGLNAIQIGIDGIITGEAKIGAQNFLAYLQQSSYLALAMWIPLAVFLFVPFAKGENRISRYKINYFLFIGCFVLLTVFFTIKPTIADADLKKVHNAIPYFSYVTFDEKYSSNKFSLEHLQGTRSLEQQQVKLLSQFKKNELTKLKLKADKKPNILFLHLESLRSDMLTADIMPELFEWGHETGEILENHYTSSSNTTAGMFGLIHGLAGSYFQSARINQFYPITLDVLKRLGYKIHVYHGKPLDYDAMDRRFFNETMDGNFYGNHCGDIHEDDFCVLEQAYSDFKTTHETKGNPRFDYIKLDSTHWNYTYPAEFEKFTPTIDADFNVTSLLNLHMKTYKRELLNRYKNASLYTDKIVSDFLKKLTSIGYLENTIVVITGDHGEEFWEHGRFGHIYGLSREQIQVISIVYFPEGLNTKYHTTSHTDFFPTIFSYMGINMDGEKIFTGKNLYEYKPEKDFALSSLGTIGDMQKHTETVISGNLKIEFNLKDSLEILKISDTDDEELLEYNEEEVGALILKSVEMKKSLAIKPALKY